jgi:hypothetical protein
MNPDLAQQALRKEKSVRNWDIEDIVWREREELALFTTNTP